MLFRHRLYTQFKTTVDINFSVRDAFLEYASSGTLKTKIFENQII
jgi:hypothetical protein